MIRHYLKYFLLYFIICWVGVSFELYFVLEPFPLHWQYSIVPLLLVAIFAYFPAKLAFALEQKVERRVSHIEIQQNTSRGEQRNSKLKMDHLTNAISKDSFNEIIGFKIIESKHTNSPLSMILFDIDHFKRINDTYGHLVGDAVLRELSEVVRANIRESEYFVRWGGEEFIVLLPGTSLDGANMVAEKLRRAIESHRFPTVGRVTSSFGVTALRTDDTIKTFIERCDEALYEAKEGGRNRVKVKI